MLSVGAWPRWIGHQTGGLGVGGSNPPAPTNLNFANFEGSFFARSSLLPHLRYLATSLKISPPCIASTWRKNKGLTIMH